MFRGAPFFCRRRAAGAQAVLFFDCAEELLLDGEPFGDRLPGGLPHGDLRRPSQSCWVICGYAIGSVAFSTADLTFSTMMLIYANKVLGLRGTTASLILSLVTVWDACLDVSIGHMSDKTRSRLGRRHPYMYASAVLVPLAFSALLRPVVVLESHGSRACYLLVCSMLVRSSVTLFDVPSSALVPDLELDYDRRSSWLAARWVAGWYGATFLLMFNFTCLVGRYGVGRQEGYSLFADVGSVAMFVCILVSALSTQKAALGLPLPEEGLPSGGFASELRQALASLRNPNFLALFRFNLATGLYMGISNSLALYNLMLFFAFTPTQLGLMYMVLLLAPSVAFGWGPWVGRRLGKKRAAMLLMFVSNVIGPWPMVLQVLGLWPRLGGWDSCFGTTAFALVSMVCAVSGAMLIDSMTADVVEDSQVATGERSEGLFFATRTFALKSISAGGVAIAGVLVTATGLDEVRRPEDMTDEIRATLAACTVPTTLLLQALALFFMSRFNIDREQHSLNVSRINSRAASGRGGGCSE